MKTITTIFNLFASFVFLAFTSLNAQVTVTPSSSLANMVPCSSQTVNLTISNSVPFLDTDTVYFIVTNSGATEVGDYSVSDGDLTNSGDTLFVTEISNGVLSSFNLQYEVTATCASFAASATNFAIAFNYALNSEAWQVVNSTANINSPFLNYIGGDQLNIINGQIGNAVQRSFYYTNSNNSVPFNGVVEFIDTLPLAYTNSALTLDTIFVGSANATVIDYTITDSTVSIRLDVFGLGQSDTLIIHDVAYLHDCVLANNNHSRYSLRYGCDTSNFCRTVVHSGGNETSIAQDPNDKPVVEVIYRDFEHANCYTDTIERVNIYKNVGQGVATGATISFSDRHQLTGLTFLDTLDIKIYLNEVIVGTELPISVVNTNYYLPWIHVWDVAIEEEISPGDSIIVVHKEYGKCLNQTDYIGYFNTAVSMHDVYLSCKFEHPCAPSETGYYIVEGNANHLFDLQQEFNNLNGQIADGESLWFEVDNVSSPMLGNQQNKFAYDITNSQIEVELILEQGLSLSDHDSIFLVSNYGGVTNYLLPVEVVEINMVPSVSGTGDTIRATFQLPATFQEVSPPAFNQHYEYQASTEFLEFFSNSSVRFQLTGHCDYVSPDGRADIEQRVFFIVDTNCVECKIPMSRVEDFTNLNCPGCILPGWNFTAFDIERINIGYADTNNNFYPDAFALQPASPSDVKINSVIIGDTLRFDLQGFVSNGDPINGLTFNTIGFDYDEGQLVFKGSVEKLKFIGAEGIFTFNGTPYSITIPESAGVYYGDSVLTIDMSTNSLNSYGVSGITAYNESCQIELELLHKVIGNYDDGDGANPYVDVKEVNAFYYFGGVPFGQPDLIPDANIVDIDTLISWTSQEREALSYWCTAYEGRFIGVGADFQIHSTQFAKLGNENFDCVYRIEEYMNAFVGAPIINQQNTFGYGISPASSNAFAFELRNLYNLDSITFFYPSDLETYDVLFYTSTHRFDTVSVTSKWSDPSQMTYSVLNSTLTDTSITLYPEQFIHQNTEFIANSSFGGYDENTFFHLNVLLKNKECSIKDTIPITYPFIHHYFSNFPGALNGDTLIISSVEGDQHSVGVGAFSSIDLPNPEFNVSANQVAPVVGYNYALDVNIGVDFSPVYDNYHNLIDRTNNIAYNSFVVFESPSGNFGDFHSPELITSLTNYFYSTFTETITPQTVLPVNVSDSLFALGPIGGSQFSNLAKEFQINSNYDCSSIPPGGIDSIYMIYGWNCFEYPALLDEACFADTLVLYVGIPETGLEITLETPASVALCDTLNFSAEFDPTGEGELSNILVEINTFESEGLDYLASSAYLEFDGVDYYIEPSIQDSLFTWELDSLLGTIQNFNGVSPTATLYFSLTTGCGISDDTMSIQLSGTNFCGQVIQDLTYGWSAEEIIDLPVLDSLVYSVQPIPMNSCMDSLLIDVTLYNVGSTSSGTFNEFEIVLPTGFDYLNGWSPSTMNGDTLIFPIDSPVLANDSITYSFYLSAPDSLCGSFYASSNLYIMSPYFCDANMCFYLGEQNTPMEFELPVFEANFSILDIDPTIYCLEDTSTIEITYESNFDGSLTIVNGVTSQVLAMVSVDDTGAGSNTVQISLSDAADELLFITEGCACTDTISYTIACDSICQADASFDLGNHCLGDTIFVSANSTDGSSQWIYSYFNMTQSGSDAIFPAVASGNFTITHIFEADCDAVDTVSISFTVYEPQQVPIQLIGTNPFCVGDSVLLVLQDAENYSGFVWSTGDTTSSIWATAAGNYSVEFVDTNGCLHDCSMISVQTVNTPTPSFDTLYVCSEMDSIQLTAVAGYEYSWMNGSQNQSITVVGSGIYTVQLCDSSASTCCSVDSIYVLLSTVEVNVNDTTICQGDPILMNATGTSGDYVWSNGATGTTAVYNSVGNHWVQVTNEHGCVAVDSFAINSIEIASSNFYMNDTICVSDTLTCLYPDVVDSNYQHEWIFELNGMQFHNFSAAPCFDFDTEGTLIVTHILTSMCGSDTTTQHAVIVDYNLNSCITIIGQNPFCEGDSVILTTSGAFTSIQWTNQYGEVVGESGSLVVYDDGIYSATTTNEFGCENTCICTELTMLPSIPLNIPDTTLCPNQELTVYLPSGLNGIWDNAHYGNSFTIDEAGEYVVEVPGNNCYLTDTFVVTELEMNFPISWHRVKCTYHFSTPSLPGYTYSWANGSNVFGNSNTASITLSTLFPYTAVITLTVTDPNGCVFQQTVNVNVVTCLGIVVFPNPISWMATISYDLDVDSESYLQISDINGRLLKEYRLDPNSDRMEIDMGNMDNGLYFFNVFVDGRLFESVKVEKID